MIEQRQRRAQIFGETLFSDPAWDILLALMRVELAGSETTVTELATASGTAPATCLRWVDRLMSADLIERRSDALDRRLSLVRLTATGSNGMRQYLVGLHFEPASAPLFTKRELNRALPVLQRLIALAET